MALAFVRRTASGQGFHTPDKNHIHHRLLRLGHGHRRTVDHPVAWTALLSRLRPASRSSTRASTSSSPSACGVLLSACYTWFIPLRNRAADPRRRGGRVRRDSGAVSDGRAAAPGPGAPSANPERPPGDPRPVPAALLGLGSTIAVTSALSWARALGGRAAGTPARGVSDFRDRVGNGRRRGERGPASPAFPLITVARARKPPATVLPRLLRRITSSLPCARVHLAVVVASARLGRRVAVGVVARRWAGHSQLAWPSTARPPKSSCRGDQTSTGSAPAAWWRKTSIRLGIITVVALGALVA